MPKKIITVPKKIITVNLLEISPYELEGTLVDLRNQLYDWIDKFGPTARLRWNPDNWPRYQDSPSPLYEITVDREETNEEFEKRIEHESLLRSQNEARELAELERLQKKFAGKK